MKRLGFAWPLLLFVLAHCGSAPQRCPDPQLLVNGRCVDLCDDLDCDDNNECTLDECEVNEQALTAGCVRTNTEDGSDCDARNGPGLCMAGQCEPITGACDSVDCDDGNECTIDGTCNISTGQCEGGQDAQEDVPCEATGVCDDAGNCVECNRPQQCDDDNTCTQDVCSDGGSCDHESVTGRACDYMGGSQNGVCDAQGSCGAAPPTCNPNPCEDTGSDCTENVCIPADGSCSLQTLDAGACNDAPGGNPGTCEAGLCVGLCDGEVCDDGNDCTDDGTCNPANGRCDDREDEPSGASCDQDGGQYCNGAGSCVQCTTATHCDDQTYAPKTCVRRARECAPTIPTTEARAPRSTIFPDSAGGGSAIRARPK